MSVADDRVPETVRDYLDEGHRAALATVVRTWGSAPRREGAQLAIADDMRFMGSISGGCVEGAVITEALAAMQDGQSRVLTFGVSDDDAFAVGLACGGEIAIMVEPVGTGNGPTRAELDALLAARAARQAVIREVDTATWARRLVPAGTDPAAIRDKSGMEGSLFREVHNPPLRMVLVGAVHIAQPLAAMARMAGYDVALCDPRDSFAAASRFPGEQFLDGWPDEALAAFAPDTRTAVVTLSHDPKIDTPALKVALASPAFYVGALGSTRTHAKRVAELTAAGLAPEAIGRIHAPVGLDIGASSPAEIAVSILAQITERLRRPETRPAE
jgi:xanthine dehydrogenase accessory factor